MKKLRTVDRIIRSIYHGKYFFSRSERKILRDRDIINGIGASGGINFSDILESNVKFFKSYDPKKVKQLFLDMRKVSERHDAQYWEGGNWFHKIRADWLYAKANKGIFHWSSKKNQRRVFWIIFLALLFRGNPAFAFGKKKDILDFIYPKI